MALINYQDYFDFNGLENAIKDAEAANKSFGASVESVNKRIKQSYDEIGTELKQYVTTLNNFNVNQKNAAASLVAVSKEIDGLKAKQQQQIQVVASLAATTDLATASVNDLKTASKAIVAEYNKVNAASEEDIEYKKQLVAENQRLTQALKVQTEALKSAGAAIDFAEGSYKALDAELRQIGAQLKALPNAFDLVTGEINQQNKEAVELSKKYVQLNTVLKNSDAALGNHQRNVGNYRSGFQGLNLSVAQVTRELPSAAISMQTFFLAISNNLPIVADELARTKTEIAALKAEGKTAPSIMQALGSALFSWQTLLSVGITLLTVYGGELADWVKEMFNGADATEEAAEKLKEYSAQADAAKSSLSSFNTELQQLQALFNINNRLRFFGDDAQTNLTEARNNLGFVIAEYNKLSTAVEDASQRSIKAGEELAKFTDTNSEEFKKANEDYEKIVKSQFDLQEEQQKKLNELQVARRQVELAQKEFDADALERQKKLNEELANKSFEDQKAILEYEIEKQKEIINNDKILYLFRDQAAQTSHDLVIKLTKLELAYRKTSWVEAKIAFEKNEKELNKNLEKIFADRYKMQQQAAIAPPESDEEILARAKAQHEKFLSDYIKIVREGGKAIITQENINQLDQQAALDKAYDNKEISFEKHQQETLNLQKKFDRLRLESQIATLQAELASVDPNSNRAAELTEQIKRLQAAIRGLTNETKDFSKAFANIYLNLEAVANIAGNAAASFFNDLTHTVQTILETGKAGLNDYAQTAISLGYGVVDQLNRASERRIQQLEKEKERELELAANNADARVAIQKRYDELIAKEKRKEAQANKVNALFQIAVNTAVAASKAASQTGIGAAIAVPIVIALGAAQAAIVLAQPLPQFEKGTENAPEGYAVVDEKGSELIVDRHGRLKEVGRNEGPRVTYLDQGDKVYTAEQTKQILTKNIIEKQDEYNIMREMQLNTTLSNRIQQSKRQEAIYVMSEALRANTFNRDVVIAAFKDAVKEIPIFQTIFDEKGIRERERRRNDLTTFRNAYSFSHKTGKN